MVTTNANAGSLFPSWRDAIDLQDAKPVLIPRPHCPPIRRQSAISRKKDANPLISQDRHKLNQTAPPSALDQGRVSTGQKPRAAQACSRFR